MRYHFVAVALAQVAHKKGQKRIWECQRQVLKVYLCFSTLSVGLSLSFFCSLEALQSTLTNIQAVPK